MLEMFINQSFNLLKDTLEIANLLDVSVGGFNVLFIFSWGGLISIFVIMLTHMLTGWI